nr:glycoprotease family protein [Streptococcus thermophilus]
MNVLAIDTATTDLVAGIVDAGSAGEPRVLAEAVTETRAHNELLVPTVMELLSQAGLEFNDLGAVVVGCGPGPFTGLRVGMSTASAFGQALSIPVHGVCTHDAVAALAHRECEEGSSLIVTDARRREVYWARYEAGQRVAGPDVVAPAALDVVPADVISCPETLRGQLPAELIDAARHTTYIPPRPAGLVAVADLGAIPEPLVPLYLRRPDAKEPSPKPKSPAIPDVDL